MQSPKALSLGAALFLVIMALAAKSLVIKDITQVNQGILGGPVALAALQEENTQASLDGGIQTSEEEASPELSTGSLDGAQVLALKTNDSEENTFPSSLTEENDAAIQAASAAAAEARLEAKTASSRYFIQPTSGRNWGELHGYNAVDIGSSCGTPVLAAADGVVVKDRSLGSGASGWNGGSGRFILLEHPNGTKTRYAHLSKIYVVAGESVKQGEQIGSVGNNGNVRGATGCHLHFEVIGATNPFIRG